MPVPLSQMWTVASYAIGKKLRGEKRYPLVLMLEPLLRCNLACAGCGKIQHPAETLRRELTPAQCFAAADECAAPVVSVPGGEPLLHPQIEQIIAGLVQRRKFVYLCTNGLLLESSLHKFAPSKYFSFSVHLDGLGTDHDRAVCRDGVYEVAVRAIQAALDGGFRVTTNTTLYSNADPDRVRQFFDAIMKLGVEAMTISPGYTYEKAPDQDHFLTRKQTQAFFRNVLEGANRGWRFNHTPLFLEFLRGNWDFECTPWGNPTYNVFGWQKPCYLVDDGYCETFAELMSTTDWDRYGRSSGNPKCGDCMVHCGHEPTAVSETFGSAKGFLATAYLTVKGQSQKKPAGMVPGRPQMSS